MYFRPNKADSEMITICEARRDKRLKSGNFFLCPFMKKQIFDFMDINSYWQFYFRFKKRIEIVYVYWMKKKYIIFISFNWASEKNSYNGAYRCFNIHALFWLEPQKMTLVLVHLYLSGLYLDFRTLIWNTP